MQGKWDQRSRSQATAGIALSTRASLSREVAGRDVLLRSVEEEVHDRISRGRAGREARKEGHDQEEDRAEGAERSFEGTGLGTDDRPRAGLGPVQGRTVGLAESARAGARACAGSSGDHSAVVCWGQLVHRLQHADQRVWGVVH